MKETPSHPSAPDAEPPDDTVLRTELVGDGVVAVIGEVDLWSAPKLLAALEQADARYVDLSGVTFIDVAGLRALASVRELQVARMGVAVDHLVRLCGWTDWRRAATD